MRGLGAGPAHEALRQAQDRVRSMALVHEMLYQSTSLSEVDLPGYVGQLVRNLSVGYAAGTRVKTVLDLTPVALPLDTSIPFGLIVNELVSNAFKYAFPDDRRGTLTVALRGGADRAVELEVRDDGPGLPADLDPFATRSLGLRLVRDLARQIGGSVAVRRTGGTAFVLSFPAPPGGCPPRADHPGSEP
jgi:two-component sensor histidine kinase